MKIIVPIFLMFLSQSVLAEKFSMKELHWGMSGDEIASVLGVKVINKSFKEMTSKFPVVSCKDAIPNLQNMNDSIWNDVYEVDTNQIWTYGKFGGWIANCVEPIKYNNDFELQKNRKLIGALPGLYSLSLTLPGIRSGNQNGYNMRDVISIFSKRFDLEITEGMIVKNTDPVEVVPALEAKHSGSDYEITLYEQFLQETELNHVINVLIYNPEYVKKEREIDLQLRNKDKLSQDF
jgi:hypothetical protein